MVPVAAAPAKTHRWLRPRVIVPALAVLAAIAVAAFVWQREARPPTVAFETAAIDRGPVVAKVTATGTASALVTVQVGSQVSGRIQQLFADFNARVKKGQIVAKLDPQLYEAALEQAKANQLAARSNVERAEAQHADAVRTLERAQRLFDRALIAQADLDTAQTAVSVAKATVGAAEGSLAQSRAALHQAEVNLQYTTIVSPIDGIVVSRNVDVGQTVAAAFQSPTLFVLAEDLRRMQVDTSVSEADVGKLRAGMKATFHVDAFPKETFAGIVREIRNAPQMLQNVVTYDAVIDVANEKLQLRPGMTANVTFIVEERAEALRVPNTALRFTLDPALAARFGVHAAVRDDDEVRRNVWYSRNGQPVAVAVTPGITDGTFTELVDSGGLRNGDTLIVDAPANAAKPRFSLFGRGPR